MPCATMTTTHHIRLKTEHERNTSRISWMDAQCGLTIEDTLLIPGCQRQVEILDNTETVIGRGQTLIDALDDAMGGTT
jgi:hypothetical protein